MVNNPLSRGLGNIAKLYLITCSQSARSKLKKHEFCWNFNVELPIYCCIPMSKLTENDVHLWIGDMLPIIYELRW